MMSICRKHSAREVIALLPHLPPSTSMVPKGHSATVFNCRDLHFTTHAAWPAAQCSLLLHQWTKALRCQESWAQMMAYSTSQLWHLPVNTELDQVREPNGPEGWWVRITGDWVQIQFHLEASKKASSFVWWFMLEAAKPPGSPSKVPKSPVVPDDTDAQPPPGWAAGCWRGMGNSNGPPRTGQGITSPL